MPDSELDEKSNTAKWLIPAIISGIIGLAAIWQGYKVGTSAQQNQQALEVSKLKAEIIGSARTYDFRIAQMLLKHALKPIDSPASYADFEKDFTELMSEKAPQAPRLAAETPSPLTDEPLPSPSSKSELKELVKQFRGSDRWKISDRFIQLYEQDPRAVVDALIQGILPPNDEWSYRVNLYIAFTLARIRPGWRGTEEQRNEILKLKDTNNYKEPTFRRRVDEALANYRG